MVCTIVSNNARKDIKGKEMRKVAAAEDAGRGVDGWCWERDSEWPGMMENIPCGR